MPVALQFVALVATALQWVVGYRILQRRPLGPFAATAAAMFFLNGFASLQLALVGTPPVEAQRWFFTADGATGPLILTVGLLLLRFPRHDQWDRLAVAITGLGAAWALIIVSLGAIESTYLEFLQPRWQAIHSLPGYLGLGLAGFATARAAAKASSALIRDVGLLGFAYVSALTANIGAPATIGLLGQFRQPFIAAIDPRYVGIMGAIFLAYAALVYLAWPRSPHARWRRYLLLAWAGGALLHLAGWLPRPIGSDFTDYTIYLLFTASSYFVRPICIGLVLVGRRTLWALYDSAVVGALIVLAKSISFLVGVPIDRIEPLDVTGLGVALLLAPLAFALPRGLGRRPSRQDDAIPSDQQLAQYLLARFADAAAPFASKDEIERATGIKENNLAAAVRRLEQRLGADLPTGSFVATRVIGVRGRKQYRLTPEGARRAALTYERP